MNLHYTLLLLIHSENFKLKVPERDLHYTLLLLILSKFSLARNGLTRFTLHFATINTSVDATQVALSLTFTLHFATINTLNSLYTTNVIVYLHYTLLLLILDCCTFPFTNSAIYITLCYY